MKQHPRHITLHRLPSVRTAVLVLVCLGTAGCMLGCHDIAPEGPERLPPPVHERPALLSTLSVPVEIPIDEISLLVNRVVRQDLYSERDRVVRRGLLRARLDLDIRRNGPIYTRTRDGLIINHLPLKAEGRVRVPPGIWRPFETTFTIHAVTEVSLDEDWRTVAHTLGTFTWEETPSITVLGIKISLQGVAEKALTNQLALLAPRIDGIIADRINLRRRVERVWNNLSEPIAIRQTPPVWLTIRPVDTYFSPGVSRNDTFIVGLQVHAYVETSVGDRPKIEPMGDLPPLHLLPDSLAADTLLGFQVNLPVSITYDDARALLKKNVFNKHYDVKDQVAVKVNEIDLYGHGPTLVAQVDFSANVTDTFFGTRGRIYLTGLPQYDPASVTIRVDSFDYDVHSRNALAEAADWMFREDFLEQTRDELIFPLTDNLAATKKRLEEAFHNRPLGKHIILNGTVDELVPGALYLVDDGLNIDVFARGKLTARVHSLDQIRRRAPPDTMQAQDAP